MTYLHPRDFDATQPIINELSMIRKFKSYVGLKSAESKLEKWLSDFEFTDMAPLFRRLIGGMFRWWSCEWERRGEGAIERLSENAK